MRKRIVNWANILIGAYSDTIFIMTTLTYGPEYEWQPNHIRSFMISMQKLLGKNILAYAWVAEIQKRGAIHYHVMILVPKDLEIGEDFPYPDQSGLWPYGFTRVEVARSPFYLVTYLGKEYQKDFSRFPKGIRVFAVYIRNDEEKKNLRFQSLRLYQQEFVSEFGWSELKALINIRKSVENEENMAWQLWGFKADKKSAIEEADGLVAQNYIWKGRSLFVEEKDNG